MSNRIGSIQPCSLAQEQTGSLFGLVFFCLPAVMVFCLSLNVAGTLDCLRPDHPVSLKCLGGMWGLLLRSGLDTHFDQLSAILCDILHAPSPF